jgi:hypothetical protein
MKVGVVLLAVVAAICCAGRAFAHGEPIIVTATGDVLTTNGNVFNSELEPAGPVLFTDIPGFELHGFQTGDVVEFDIVDHLWYWNAAQGVTPAADGLEFLVEGKEPPFPFVSVSHNAAYEPGGLPFVPGFTLDVIDAQSSQHQHLLAYLMETTEPPAGAYGIMLQVKSEGYETTPPFLIAFNVQLGGLAFRDGIAAIAEQAFFVDGPGLLGDFNEDGLVDAVDIDLLYAHRGSDEPDIYDLVPDSTIDDLDAAFWVEEIVGTVFGDVNLDRAVDLFDLNAVRNNFGASGGWAAGDTDGSGVVDLADLNAVRNNFGFTPAKAVPEPGTFALLAMAGVTFAVFRQRRLTR